MTENCVGILIKNSIACKLAWKLTIMLKSCSHIFKQMNLKKLKERKMFPS